MGIFFNGYHKLRNINEAEIDGVKQDDGDEVEDYNAPDTDEGGSDDTPTETSDTSDTNSSEEPEDYTSGIEDAGEGGDDEASSEDTTDTPTETSDTSDTNSSEEPEDYTSGIEDAGEGGSDEGSEGGDSGSDDTGDTNSSEEPEDYTSGIGDAGEGGSDEGSEGGDDTESNESSDDESSEESEGEEGEDDNSFENLKKIESELFSNLTPEQITIKNYELKQNFISLYSTIGTTLVRINDISKSDDNIEVLTFVTDKLLELREMIDFNITTAYDTRTFIENNIIYQQCISTLNAISDIIASIPSPAYKDQDEDELDNIVDDGLEDSENMETSQRLDISDKMIENTDLYNDYL